MRQGMLLSCVALVIGLPIALAASKVAARVLYGIAPHDLMTFTLVPIFLAAVALLACGFRLGGRLRLIRRRRCGTSRECYRAV